ncbi:hypothetical protein WA026_009730 [Henosepilachna vigintioctopunctata]|uniref:Uncharacterized protein n=1 Tax=Henosepilachna vigintioctopunctata TaxID=420089 RepID=A0AAW1TK58_9CUCU
MENLVELYSNLPKSYIEEQWINIAESFKILRNGHFTFGLFSQRMSEEDKINRIKVALGLEMQRAVSNDSFFNNLKQYHPTDWRAKIKITEERLESARYTDEIIYFNYELARYHLEIGKPEFAHSFARRCVRSARENQDVKWLINGMLLMAKANIRNNNKIDTIKVLEKTLHISRTLDCAEMVEFLTVALDVVRQVDFTTALDARGVILKRQKQILHLLKDNDVNRMKAEVLFKKISFVPAKRTMSMIPGIKIVDNIHKEKTSRNRVKSAKPTTGQERRGIEFYDYVKDFVDV